MIAPRSLSAVVASVVAMLVSVVAMLAWENCWDFAGEEGTDPARRRRPTDV